MTTALWETAEEVAAEALDAFSELHSHIRMNRKEWSNLRAMIEREVVGHFAENTAETTLCARDLLADERLTKGKMS